MSRSGYSDECDGWELIKWRGIVASATRGRRGQKFFHALLEALDAMPEKILIKGELESGEGDVCAIGALGKYRGLDVAGIDPENEIQVALAFDIAPCLAQEVVFMNDEWGRYDETPQQRWARMREWVQKQIKGVESDAQ